MKDWNSIEEMICSAPTKKDAMDMLESWRVFSTMSEEDYKKGKKLIKEEFTNC